MQQMASRPFATINVALETDEEPPDLIGGNVKVSTTFSQRNLRRPPETDLLCGLTGRQAAELYPSLPLLLIFSQARALYSASWL